MVTLRKAVTPGKVISALCLAASLAGLAAYAASPAATASATTAQGGPGGHGWHHRGHHGGMFFVLHKLNLTPDQKTEVKAIFAGQKSQFEALRTSAQANRTALVSTAPTDPNYPALIATAQKNAATRIQLESEAWTAIYAKLSQAQVQAIPGIVAAAQQAREARVAEWKAQHPAAGQSAD